MSAKTYIGKPCVKCGSRERYVSNNQCIECSHNASERWRVAHSEQARENTRRWQMANREKHQEYNRRWYLANLEKARESWRRWRLANLEKCKELQRRRYRANPKKSQEHFRRWYLVNKEKDNKRCRFNMKLHRDGLDDSYICSLLKKDGISNPSPELIAAKRAHLQLLRLVRNTQHPTTGATV